MSKRGGGAKSRKGKEQVKAKMEDRKSFNKKFGILYHRSDNRKPCSNSSIYKGVRPRKSGRFAAQIRDLKGDRLWLGTFNTELEAANAYSRKQDEFEAILEAQKKNSALDCDQGIKEASDLVHSSQSSDQGIQEDSDDLIHSSQSSDQGINETCDLVHSSQSSDQHSEIEFSSTGNDDMVIDAEIPFYEDEQSVLHLLDEPVAPSLD